MNIEINDSDPVYTIGIIADKFNISVHTLRLYESEGLILPFKTETKRRLYSNNDIRRIKCIRDMIENQKLNFAGIKWALSMIPCWKLLPCTEKDRESCDAYTETTMPCWSVPHKAEKCQKLDCRECHVYQNFSNCNNFKEYLKAKWK
jgi:MerR family transcriptional regulator/heat shock protein HspR